MEAMFKLMRITMEGIFSEINQFLHDPYVFLWSMCMWKSGSDSVQFFMISTRWISYIFMISHSVSLFHLCFFLSIPHSHSLPLISFHYWNFRLRSFPCNSADWDRNRTHKRGIPCFGGTVGLHTPTYHGIMDSSSTSYSGDQGSSPGLTYSRVRFWAVQNLFWAGRCPKLGLNPPFTAQNCPKLPKTTQNCLKLPTDYDSTKLILGQISNLLGLSFLMLEKLTSNVFTV